MTKVIKTELFVGNIQPGARIRLLHQMVNKNSTWKPVEDNMPAGLEGTVVYVNTDGPPEFQQIGVRWDNGSHLNLLPEVDLFQIIPQERE